MRAFQFSVVIFLSVLFMSLSVVRGEMVQLTYGPGNDSEATWSPDGKWIAFQSDRSGRDAIYLLEMATGKARKWSSGFGNACYPAWSPDGNKIVFVYANITNTAFEGIKNGYNIYMRSAHGNEPAQQLTFGLYVDTTPIFFPNGRRILFSSTRGKSEETSKLYTISIDGGSLKLFLETTSPTRSSWIEPVFSPDGSKFAASYSSGNGLWHIYVGRMNAPAERVQLWTNNVSALYAPAWSPVRNDTIAFTGYVAPDKGWNIYLRHGQYGAISRLTDSSGNSRSPAWSPDGHHLVFENNQSGHYKLYLMDMPPVSEPDAGFGIEDTKISASSGSESAGFAFDGKINDDAMLWMCKGTNQYWQILFDKPRKISEVRVYSGILDYWKNPSGTQNIKAFKVAGLINGKWRSLGKEVKNIATYNGELAISYFAKSVFNSVAVDGIRVIITASGDTLKRMRSPYKPCVAPDKAVTYIREITLN